MVDVIIVGGSAAGLSAAMVLGRFRRRVLILDQQKPRNAPAEAAHNFFTRDGTPPADLLQIGREQLRPYTTVEMHTAEVVGLTAAAHGFDVKTAVGDVWQSQRVLLATGVRDELPPIPGMADYWGKGGVHYCPYCHGWEVCDQKIVLIGDGEVLYHFAALLSALSSDISALVHGDTPPTPAQRQQLQQLGVPLYEGEIEAIAGESGHVAGVRLADGRFIPCQAIFVKPTVQQHTHLAREIGCDFDENGYVQVDMLGRTNVPKVYAAGDMVSPMHQLIVAAASGTVAGSGINMDITFS